ncbi:MAG: proline--tRNA ligase [Candidatus Babeliaceae bacterium]|nr:proline--tRNA ligase [Candidatus Babeliaceae bacterium]
MNKLPNIKTHFADWYQSVVYDAELADQTPVRGCMVIRPYGYAIWERMQHILDLQFKKLGIQNAAFPLLIPLSFLQKEKEHVEGFAPEVAVVSHAGGKELEEPLVVRPTSETIIHTMFARWIHSWRDLPLKINQWCSVVRWEMRPRPFLRTSEFWWQEGHTAHETEEEARRMAEQMHQLYRVFMEEYLAMPVIAAAKPPHERFAGADETFTLEGCMQDGKALQMGTSHLISQDFARAFGITFQNRQEGISYPFLTSWGVSTRMIGGMIMTHGDQKGLIIPPKIAPVQVVIIPIFKAENRERVLEATRELAKQLHQVARITVDESDTETPGAKFYRWELKGVPLRVEIGMRDIDAGTVTVVDRPEGVKRLIQWTQVEQTVEDLLVEIQQKLFEKAKEHRAAQWVVTDETLAQFGHRLAENNGFYEVGWSGDEKAIVALKEFGGTIRCVLPTHQRKRCFYNGSESRYDIVVAKAY